MPEHVRILETSAGEELSTVDGILSENARQEVREVGRRGLEILHKHVLSKRKTGLSVEEKRRKLQLRVTPSPDAGTGPTAVPTPTTPLRSASQSPRVD